MIIREIFNKNIYIKNKIIKNNDHHVGFLKPYSSISLSMGEHEIYTKNRILCLKLNVVITYVRKLIVRLKIIL